MLRLASWIAVVATLALAWPARAETDEERREAAKALMQQGTALYSEGAYKEALKKFHTAYDMLPNPKIFFNIGLAAMKAGDDVEAANAFSSFLDRTLDAGDITAQRSSAKEHLTSLIQHLGRIRVQGPPPDAKVAIDQRTDGSRSLFVTPGSHTVDATEAGFNDAHTTVQVLASEDKLVTIDLQPKSAAGAVPIPAPAPPQVAAAPVETKEAKPNLAPAANTQATKPSGWEEPPPPASHARAIAGWSLVGGGAVMGIVSGVFGALASSADSNLKQLEAGSPPAGLGPTDAPNLRKEDRNRALISTVFTGAAIVTAGVGIYLILTEPSTPEVAPAGGQP